MLFLCRTVKERHIKFLNSFEKDENLCLYFSFLAYYVLYIFFNLCSNENMQGLLTHPSIIYTKIKIPALCLLMDLEENAIN